MDKNEVRKSIEDIINSSTTGIMATVKGNKPHARYMTFFHKELTLFTPTHRDTDKSEEVAENPNTHVLLGYEGDGLGDSYVEIEGKITIKDNQEIKQKVWNEQMTGWFDGPEDPNLIVLEVKPQQIRLMNKTGGSSETLEL